MTLILNKNLKAPSIHAFIIGIGAYPHLAEGVDPKAQILNGVNNLKQLTSPPLSAVNFYNVLNDLNNSKNLSLPLGSVEFFASEIPGSNSIPEALKSDEPNRSNISLAFDEWVNRCKSNIDNMAIFYFCGHGLEDGDHYLLTSDFGQRPNAPFDGSFNVDLTIMAFNQLKVNKQLFLVDACRSILPGMLKAPQSGLALLSPDKIMKNSSFIATFKGAAANENGFSVPNQVSFFTKAIINGLNGAVSKLKNSYWEVSSTDLYLNLEKLMNLEKVGEGDMLRSSKSCDESFVLTRWNAPTERTVILNCSPDEALPVATLHCEEIDGVNKHKRNPSTDRWNFKTPAGFYRINATFPNQFETKSRNINVESLINEETVWCTEI